MLFNKLVKIKINHLFTVGNIGIDKPKINYRKMNMLKKIEGLILFLIEQGNINNMQSKEIELQSKKMKI